MDRARQIAKYAQERCCVCGKWGASVPPCEPVNMLRAMAKARGLTLKLPDDSAIHDKCLRKLKQIVKI